MRIKITHAVNVGQHAGSTGVVKWKFTLNCASGGCTTILKRHTLRGRVAAAKLLVVAKVVGGAVTGFAGTDMTTSKVTASGRSRGCGPVSETWTLHSVG